MDKLYFFALSYIRWGFKMHMRRVKQILGPKHWKFAKKYSAILWKLNFSTVSKFVCVVIHDVLPSVLYLLAQLLTNRCPEFCEMFCVFRTQRVDRHFNSFVNFDPFEFWQFICKSNEQFVRITLRKLLHRISKNIVVM